MVHWTSPKKEALAATPRWPAPADTAADTHGFDSIGRPVGRTTCVNKPHGPRASAWPAAQSLLGCAGWLRPQPVSVAGWLATAAAALKVHGSGFGRAAPEGAARPRGLSPGGDSVHPLGDDEWLLLGRDSFVHVVKTFQNRGCAALL